MTVPVAIDRALADPNLLGAGLGPLDTWGAWLAVLRAAFALPMSDDDREAFAAVSGGRAKPDKRVSELWCLCGRRSGKSRIAAALSVYLAVLVDHSVKLSAGETGYVLALAPTQRQARLVFGYSLAFLESSPVLRQQIEGVTTDEIRLAGDIVIATHPASFRSVRGRTLLGCVFDESAYWRDETSATPDVECYRAVIPALASTSGMLVGISSPYRRLGLLHQKHRDHFGKEGGDVLVIQAGSTVLNPTLDAKIIDKAREADPEAARAEWDAEFRSDIAALLSDDVIDAAIEHGRPLELPPQPGVRYFAFTDASAGRHDHFTIAVAHREAEDCGRIVIDALRGAAPPFDPNSVAAEFAGLAKSYGCGKVMGDAFAGEWTEQAFRAAGVEYEKSSLPRSGLYLEALPIFNRHAIEIPDHPRLVRELRLLERRTHRSGRDTVDHGTGGSDDYANSVAGVAWAAGGAGRRGEAFVGHMSDGCSGFVTVREQPEPTRVRVRKISQSEFWKEHESGDA